MLAIIQARFSSKRLRGKVLKKINKKTLLERVVNKISNCRNVSKIVVATSDKQSDDKIYNFCKKRNIECFRGNLNNVYNRFFCLLESVKEKSFIRICADSPFIDSNLIDYSINFYKKNNYQIVTNIFPRSFPKGQSIEIFNSKVFKKHAPKIIKKKNQEHVTTYFYENAKKFKIKNIKYNKNYSALNLCVDTKKDIRFARKIARKFDNYFDKKKILKKIINFASKIQSS